MTVIVILAAGSSDRLGRPKQNLVYKDNTLLGGVVNAAIKTGLETLVVLGANHELIEPGIAGLNLGVLENRNWQEGISSSIRTAVRHVINQIVNAPAIMFLVCDQPHVTTALLNDMLLTAAITEKGIVASGYNSTFGVPALFKSNYFSALSMLNGHEGAKKIMEKNIADVEVLPFEKGGVDIDTESDFMKLHSGK